MSERQAQKIFFLAGKLKIGINDGKGMNNDDCRAILRESIPTMTKESIRIALQTDGTFVER